MATSASLPASDLTGELRMRKDKTFGIRIEDIVDSGEKGVDALDNSKRDLVVVG